MQKDIKNISTLLIFLFCIRVLPVHANDQSENEFNPYFLYLQTGDFNDNDYLEAHRNLFLKFLPASTSNGPGFEFAYLNQSTRGYKDVVFIINPSMQAGLKYIKLAAHLGLISCLEGEGPEAIIKPSVSVKVGNLRRIYISYNKVEPVHWTTHSVKIHAQLNDRFSEFSIGRSTDWEQEDSFFLLQLILRFSNNFLVNFDFMQNNRNHNNSVRFGFGYAFKFKK